MNLIDIINQSRYIFFFLVVDQSLDIDIPQIKNIIPIYAFKNSKIDQLKSKNQPYFCLEESGFTIDQKNSGHLLSHQKVIEFITTTTQKSKLIPCIIPFKPSSKINFICQKNNWKIISVDPKLNRQLEDKLNFAKLCQSNNIPTIPNIVTKLNKETFQQVQSVFGQKLVAQTHFGWAGNSTFFCQKWEDIVGKVALESPIKFTPYLDGYSLLNNCCLTKFGLIQSPPGLQYTGIKQLTPNPFTTVGRQWPSLSSNDINEKVKKITEQFAEVINQMGYRGFFGLDFFVNKDQVFLLECNPRLTASFNFYSQIEIKQNINPLFAFHLLEFTDINYQVDMQQEQKRFYDPNIIGSEIVLKNDQNQTIKKHNDFVPFSPTINVDIPLQIINQLIDEKN